MEDFIHVSTIEVVYNTKFGGFSLSKKAVELLASLGHKGACETLKNNADHNYGFYIDDLERHDPLLVQVVKTLGKKANGGGSDLAIQEVNLGYSISEYDGREEVNP